MKRLLVLVLSVFLCLLGLTAQASPANPALLGATLQTTLAQSTIKLTMAHSGTGSGTTTLAPGQYDLLPDDPLLITATPDSGSFFGGWLVDITGFGTIPAYAYTIDGAVPGADTTVTANFSDSGYTFNLAVTGDGTVDLPSGSYLYASGLVVPLTATPNGAARFERWENGNGNTVSTENPYNVTIDDDKTLVAIFASPVNLTMVKAGLGSGTISPSEGTTQVFPGDPITFSATPDAGSYFRAWTLSIGGQVVPGDLSLYSFAGTVPEEDLVVTATFDTSGYALTVGTEGNGTVAPPANTYYFATGASVPLTATPTGSAAFSHWKDEADNIVSQDNPLDVVMDANLTRIAVFVDPITLTIVHTGAGTGTTVPPAGSSQVYPGTPLSISATPDAGSYFGGWVVDIAGIGTIPVNSPYINGETPPANVTATVTFTTGGYSLTVGATGDGTVDPPVGTYAIGSGLEVPLTATPNAGSFFDHWEDGSGGSLGTDNPLAVTVDGDKTCVAVFKLAGTRTLTMIKSGTGDGTTDPSSAVAPGITHDYVGGDVVLTATPNSTSLFDHWEGDLPIGVDATAATITVTMDTDRTITAVFTAADWILTTAVSGTGTVYPAPGAYGFKNGAAANVRADIIAGSGYAFSDWTGDVTGDTTSTVLPFVMDQNRSVTANFVNTGTVSLTVLTDGPGTTQAAPGVYSYLPGRTFSFLAVPDTGKFFAGWTARLDDGTGVLQPLGITLITSTLSDALPADGEITAHFGDTGHTIEMLAPEGGGTLVYPEIGSYTLADGTTFVIRAEENPGWNFVGWRDKTGTIVSTSADLDFEVTVSEDQSYQPVFALPGFTLKMIKAGTGNGTTTPASSETGTDHFVNAGFLQQLTATPASDSVFAGWSGDLPAGVNPSDTTIFVTMDTNRSITATFNPADFVLTVQLAGTANAVNMTPPPGQYGCTAGQQIQLKALPADGSPAAFQAWSGSVVAGTFSTMVTMDANKTVIANYSDDLGQSQQLVVNPPQGTGTGATDPLGPGTYRIAGGTLYFNATPNPGSYFNGWQDDYAGFNTPKELKVIMDQSRTLGVSFSNTGAEVTVIREGEGDIFPRQGVYALADGLQVPFTAQRINSTWVFDSWRDGTDTVLSRSMTYLLSVSGTDPIVIKGVFAEDVTAPEIIACAPDAQLEPNGSCQWVLPDYTGLVNATDDYGPLTLLQSPAMGESITGVTTVTITAKDMSTASPNSTCTFTVTPVDTANLCTTPTYNVDQNGDQVIDLTELMRIIQFYNSPASAYHCSPTAGTTEDGFVPGPNATLQSCAHSAADTDGNFVITLSEVLRVIQLFNAGGFFFCGDQSPDGDGVCAGQPAGVRLIHASQGAASVGLCIDGTADPLSLAYSQATPYREVSEDNHDFGVVAAGGNCASPLLNASLGLLGGARETLVVGGPSASPALFSFADDVTLPAAGKARLRFMHMNPAVASVVDLRLASNGAVWFNDIPYGGAGAYIEVNAGSYTLNVTNSAGTANIASGISLTLADGEVATLMAAGGSSGFNALKFTE